MHLKTHYKQLGAFFFHPVQALLQLPLVLYLLFEIVGVWISGNVVDFVYGGLEEHFCPMLHKFVDSYIKTACI